MIIFRYLHTAESTYGNFATVITMLWWFSLGSIVTLFGAQLNVVPKERLHPPFRTVPHGKEDLQHEHFA